MSFCSTLFQMSEIPTLKPKHNYRNDNIYFPGVDTAGNQPYPGVPPVHTRYKYLFKNSI
jgi:hypothetical protein